MNEHLLANGGADTVRASISARIGSAAELRAVIGESMALAAVHANIAADYADLGDDKGLEYALRCFAAACKAALATFADLKAANTGGRA